MLLAETVRTVGLDRALHAVLARWRRPNMDNVARRCGGRVVTPTLDGLGAEVVADYLRTRQ